MHQCIGMFKLKEKSKKMPLKLGIQHRRDSKI